MNVAKDPRAIHPRPVFDPTCEVQILGGHILGSRGGDWALLCDRERTDRVSVPAGRTHPRVKGFRSPQKRRWRSSRKES